MSTKSMMDPQPNTNKSLQEKTYIQALRHRFIHMREVKALTGVDATARMVVWRLSRQGKLVRVKNGLYAAIPPEMIDTSFEVDRYLLMDHAMDSKGALAFHSALELHGVAYSSFSTVYYLSKNPSKPFAFQDIFYKTVKSSDLFGITEIWRNGLSLQVTDKERTFLDGLRRPELCGGLEEHIKSIEGFTLMSSVKLMDYLGRFGEIGLYNKAGFILDLLKDRVNVDEDLLQVLRSRVTTAPCYLVPGGRKNGGKLVKEYNVIVPENLREMVRFV
jgi:predicted transcriptional regulator of viral defense system